MGLSGIEIFKHLPKTNCGDCGVPTCLAFAMKLAQSQAELTSCPHVSDEAKAALAEASAPPMRAITVGTGDSAFTVGEETVMFRHEKTFVNPPAIGVSVSSGASDAEIDAVIAKALAADFDRVGQRLRCGFLAVTSAGDAARFAAVATRVGEATELPLLLVTDNATEMQAALEAVGTSRPLICSATEENSAEMLALAKAHSCPVVIRAEGLAKVAELTERAMSMGVADLVIDGGATSAGRALRDRVLARRSALGKKFAALGYPVITWPGRFSAGDAVLEATYAAADVATYSGIIVLSDGEPWQMLAVLILRQNIYTDPQRPMQAEPKVYAINNPGPDAPFFITTNFSLTYFIVSSEIESGRMPAYLGVVDAEGLSVLTAWAAGKFVPERIAKFVTDSGLGDTLSHREIIIPGAVAQISGELAEELEGWNVTVGPYEAADIPVFLRRRVG